MTEKLLKATLNPNSHTHTLSRVLENNNMLFCGAFYPLVAFFTTDMLPRKACLGQDMWKLNVSLSDLCLYIYVVAPLYITFYMVAGRFVCGLLLRSSLLCSLVPVLYLSMPQLNCDIYYIIMPIHGFYIFN